MALTIKREIINKLKLIGLSNIEKSMITVMPPTTKFEQKFQYKIGQTFYIENTTKLFQSINSKELKNCCSKFFIENVDIIQTQNNDNDICIIEINFETLVKNIFKDLCNNDKFFINNQYHVNEKDRKKIIVEYSSPNIAKPFHVGNLRSTIIGNCLANIFKFYGHNVIRMNYLGDWGTQFGILSLAYDQFGDEQKLINQPLKHLFDVYVKGNKQCELDVDWRNQAKNHFYQLEQSQNSSIYEKWCEFCRLSCDELNKLYNRLGIQFDSQESESMYGGQKSIKDLIEFLDQQHNLIKKMDNGAKYVEVNDYQNNNNLNKKILIPLIKNDGTSLYITRDIAAVIHRQKQYNFNQMYYIVDNSQAKHFNNLKNLFYTIDDPVYQNLIHLRFGRIIGMSTRKGETIFLDDVLNEAKHRALNAITNSPNTKISIDQYKIIADILGVTAIIVHDLSNRRVSQYKFDWDRALKLRGNTGISLQYTHARLCNLIKNSQKQLNNFNQEDFFDDIDINAIDTIDGRNLIKQILIFDEIIDRVYDNLEPSILTHYLFDLKTTINRANQELTIKGQTKSTQCTRLLLFICAKNILNQCMKLLGLNPLESM